MGLTIKVIGIGQLTATSMNLTSAVPAGKAQIVKSMRFVNTGSSTPGLCVYLKHGTADPRLVAPKNVLMTPNAAYIDDTELNLEAGDYLTGVLSVSGTVDFVITGVQRDA